MAMKKRCFPGNARRTTRPWLWLMLVILSEVAMVLVGIGIRDGMKEPVVK